MKLFNAFVASNFNYCSPVWHFGSKESALKMEKMQKAALRIVLNDYSSDYQNLLVNSNCVSLLLSRLRSILLEVFKCTKGTNPDFMKEFFIENVHPYFTRSGPLLIQPKARTIKHGINSFVFQGGKLWNSLPAFAKEMEHIPDFKQFLLEWKGPDCKCGYCLLCTITNM